MHKCCCSATGDVMFTSVVISVMRVHIQLRTLMRKMRDAVFYLFDNLLVAQVFQPLPPPASIARATSDSAPQPMAAPGSAAASTGGATAPSPAAVGNAAATFSRAALEGPPAGPETDSSGSDSDDDGRPDPLRAWAAASGIAHIKMPFYGAARSGRSAGSGVGSTSTAALPGAVQPATEMAPERAAPVVPPPAPPPGIKIVLAAAPGGPRAGVPAASPAASSSAAATAPAAAGPPLPLRCVLCSIECNSFNTLQQHYASKRHAKRLAASQGGAAISAGELRDMAAAGGYGVPHSSPMPHVTASGGGAAAGPSAVSANAQPDAGAVPFGCALCGVACNSSATLQQHLASRRHVMRAAKAGPAAATPLQAGLSVPPLLAPAGAQSSNAPRLAGISITGSGGSGGGSSSPACLTGAAPVTACISVSDGPRLHPSCHQVLSPALDAVVTDLLQRLRGFYTRAMAENPIKAASRKRYLSGLREVKKAVRYVTLPVQTFVFFAACTGPVSYPFCVLFHRHFVFRN